MAKAKKKLLPKDFEDLLKAGDLETLKAVFDTYDVNARGGIFKQTAIAFSECPDDLARWLMERGADLTAGDSYGETPLHSRAGHRFERAEILLELGADVNAIDDRGNTPLHYAVSSGHVGTARILLDHGARVDIINKSRQTPLVYGLQRCSNSQIENMARAAELLLDAGKHQTDTSEVTPQTKELVQKIGTDFEFHRTNFNADSVDATSAALDKLYVLFDVPPVPRRTMHDGKSPIIAKAARWEDRHQELWELLIPSSGAADTVQGEVIRISGRIRDELERNGGANWDADYKKMADALLAHVASGTPLPAPALGEAKAIIADVKKRDGDTVRLCALAVDWVALNPEPVKLPRPNYRR